MTGETPALPRSGEAAVSLLHQPGPTVGSSVCTTSSLNVDAHLSQSNRLQGTVLLTLSYRLFQNLSMLNTVVTTNIQHAKKSSHHFQLITAS